MIKDTLTIYKELLASGCTEAQASMQAEQLGDVKDSFTVAIDGLKETIIKLDKDMFWMRLIGAAMVVTFMSNIIFLGIRG